jgi:hypothetical protein
MVNDERDGESKSQGTFMDNAGYYGLTALQIRLDPSEVIREIERYLRGVKTEMRPQNDGSIKEIIVWKGKPMMNERGIQAVMSIVIACFNNQVVQGNFLDYDLYADHLCRTRKELSFNLMMSMYDYDLAQENFSEIMSTLMRYIEVYMTRPINNKERESYAQTLRSSEVLSMQSKPQSSGGVGGFFKKIGF